MSSRGVIIYVGCMNEKVNIRNKALKPITGVLEIKYIGRLLWVGKMMYGTKLMSVGFEPTPTKTGA